MQLFRSSNHTIIHDDCFDVLKTHIPNNSIALIFADPPYNIGKNFNGYKDKWDTEESYLQWCYQWLDLCIEKLTDNGSLYLMAATQFMPFLDIYLRQKMTIISRIIWYYDSAGVQAKNKYGSLYEPILFCVKNEKDYIFNSESILVEAKTGAKRKLIDYRKNPPQPYNSQKVAGNVWEFPRVRYRMPEYENHPTQKPIALLERIIKASSNENDVILDPFSGTFTTSYVAKLLNRKSIGIELQEEYIKIGLRRLNIQDNYHGIELTKELKSYETISNNLPLF